MSSTITASSDGTFLSFLQSPVGSLPERTLYDIVWSCVLTIFACTWVSVHPNIPGIGETQLTLWIRRVEMMIWGILTPEMILFWSLRQWIGARRLARKYQDHGWTTTHGHFLQMGGYILAPAQRPVEILCPEKLEILLRESSIHLPALEKQDIDDRSKADGLSKSLVLVQTVWFMVQCIERKIKGLMVTQLEIYTVAFVVLNVAMYVFWWHKPLDVRRPVRVEVTNPQASYFQKGNSVQSCLSGDNLYISRFEERWESPEHDPEADIERNKYATEKIVTMIPEHPLKSLSFFVFRRLSSMRSFQSVNSTMYPPSQSVNNVAARMPTFYACPGTAKDVITCHIIVSIFSMAFAAVHCLGWSSSFPSTIERVLWRVSSLVILAIPACFLLVIFLAFVQARTGWKTFSFRLSTTSMILVPIYLIARVILLIEALMGLRNLPVTALATVQWLSFIPHL